jgi:hypothetical protein
MTPSELTAIKALVAAEEARHNAEQLTDNQIADNAATLGKANPMCDIKGPYRDRKKWRVRVTDTLTFRRTNYIFATEEEARQAIPRLEAEYRRPVGLPMPKPWTRTKSISGPGATSHLGDRTDPGR